jgi:GT2 family glycosyltransferase
VEYVQFIDGDCELRTHWLPEALSSMKACPDAAAVFGRRREREPRRNIYHLTCDVEWAVPAGEVESCGGDVLFRVRALRQVDGYSPDLIAGEEPDLCHRLRRQGWRILCNGKEMTWHDVSIDRFGQAWRRAQRAGYAFAQLSDRYRGDAEPSWQRLVGSALLWSAVFAGTLLSLVAYLLTRSQPLLALTLVLAVGIVARIGLTARNARASFDSFGDALKWSALLFVSKLSQTQGALIYLRRRQAAPRLIEYK